MRERRGWGWGCQGEMSDEEEDGCRKAKKQEGGFVFVFVQVFSGARNKKRKKEMRPPWKQRNGRI